jgi:hypothetical protein
MTADPSGTVPSGADPTPRSTRHWIHRWFVFLIVGFAGFCSLVYQVVWERTLKYNFGGDSVSAAIVTATFLLGLGIGAVAFGRWRRQPFAAFALVELGLGTFAIASYHPCPGTGSMMSGLAGRRLRPPTGRPRGGSHRSLKITLSLEGRG